VDVVFRFARDSPLEGAGFEPSVPRPIFNGFEASYELEPTDPRLGGSAEQLWLKSFGNWRGQLKREDVTDGDARRGRHPRLRHMVSPLWLPPWASKCPRHNALTASRSMQPEPSHPASFPNDLGSRQNRASPAHNLTTSRARNGRSRSFPDLAENFPDAPI